MSCSSRCSNIQRLSCGSVNVCDCSDDEDSNRSSSSGDSDDSGEYGPGGKYGPGGRYGPGGELGPGGEYGPGGKYAPGGPGDTFYNRWVNLQTLGAAGTLLLALLGFFYKRWSADWARQRRCEAIRNKKIASFKSCKCGKPKTSSWNAWCE